MCSSQLAFVGGVLNATWNLPGNPGAPAWFRAVGSLGASASAANAAPAWRWEHFWLVVNLVSILNNLAYILPLLGPTLLREALANSEAYATPAVVCASLSSASGERWTRSPGSAAA